MESLIFSGCRRIVVGADGIAGVQTLPFECTLPEGARTQSSFYSRIPNRKEANNAAWTRGSGHCAGLACHGARQESGSPACKESID